MGYIRDNLMPNEHIIFTAKVNPAVYLSSVFSCIFTLLPIGAVFFLIPKAVIISTPSASPPNLEGQNIIASMLMWTFLCVAGILFISTLVSVLEATIIMLTTEFAITNRRIFAKTGFIRRHTLEVFLQKVESVRVYQNILGRLLNFGTVTVTGTGGTREGFRAISDPLGVRNKINQVIEQYNQQTQSKQ